MKQLLGIAFKAKAYRILISLTILAMCLLTFASQLEIFSLGVITRKGPDAFELFGSNQQGKLEKGEVISKDQLEKRWNEIDSDHKGYITQEETREYIAKHKKQDIIEFLITNVDRVFPVTQNLKNLAIMLFLIAVFKAVMLFTHRFLTRVTVIRISRDLRQKYFEHIQSLPMTFYQQYNIGSLSSRVVGDSVLIADAINACLTNYMQTPIAVISSLSICFLTSWQLSMIIFLGFPLIVFPIVFLAKHVKRIATQIQKNQEHFASVLIDFLAGIQTVKMFAMEDFSLNKYREHNRRMAKLEKRSARYDLSARPVVHTVGMFFLATALVYGLYILQLNVSVVLFYCGILYVFYEPIKKFAEENNRIQQGMAAADRMFEVMNIKPQIEDAKDAKELQAFTKSIEFNHVWFRYGEQWVLQDLSFTVEKGQTVAIVGPTGAGKSTIVQLIPRLFDIQKGEILIDGQPLTAYTQKSLRDTIAFVPQKPFLFLDTVAANISFGRDFSKEQIVEAAKRAHADEFIRALPQGYDTPLSETGKNLSGGQQQRLAIARALVKEAPILIMDEATSSLDSISESYIKSAIHQLRGQMTQIIIAHRLSTIEDADKIIYLDQGRKVAEGTREELLEKCNGFRLMWEMLNHTKETTSTHA